ncbi:MAG: YfhO family protein [Candidatus Xenobia bacterium]
MAGSTLLLLLLVVLRMGWLQAASYTPLVSEDLLGQHLPFFYELHRAALEHRLPGWDPGRYAGMPLLGNPQAAVFYPLHLFAYLLPPVPALEIELTLYIAIFAIGMAAWLRALGLSPAAAAFGGACSIWVGGMTQWVRHPLWTMCWLPFTLWAWERKRLPLVVLGMVLMILGGSLHLLPMIALFFIVLQTAREPARLLQAAACAALAVLLTAFWWVPVLHLLQETPRTHLAGTDYGLSHSLSLASVPGLFFPEMFTREWSYGLSLCVTLLALAGLRGASPVARKPLWLLAAFSLLMALGHQGLLLPLCMRILPPMRLTRAPERYGIGLAIAMCALAAAGWERLRAWRPALAAAVVALTLLEGWMLYPMQFQPRSVTTAPPFWHQLPEGSYRVLASPPACPLEYVNWGGMEGHPNLAGFDPASGWPYLQWAWYIDHDDPPPPQYLGLLCDHDNILQVHGESDALLRLLDVRYTFDMRGWHPLPPPLPHYRLVPRATIIPDRVQLLARLRSFDPQAEVLLEANGGTAPTGQHGTVQELQHGVGDCTLAVSGDGGWLVISEVWDAGWQARIDGQAVPLQRGDGILCALPVPSGSHRVRLHYVPSGLLPGLLVSAAGLLLGAALYRRA